MRKSFTQLFSVLMLICAFGFTAMAGTVVGPVVATENGLSPADGAKNVEPTTTEFVITFDQNVQFTASGGTFTISKGATSPALIKSITLQAGSSVASIDGAVLTVTHGLTLEEGETYTIGISGSAIENADSEKFGGIPGGDWSFTVGDYTAPKLATADPLVPADGAEHVDARGTYAPFKLTMKFDEEVKAGEGNIYIYEEDGTIVDIIPVNENMIGTDHMTVTVPVAESAIFAELADFHVLVDAGAFTDDVSAYGPDAEANEFAGISDKTVWNFTTRDYTAPVFDAAEVVSKTKIGVTFSVTMNEPATVHYSINTTPAMEGDFEVATAGTAVQKVISSGLTHSTSYTITLTAKNKEENNAEETAQTDAKELKFTTVDDQAPTVVPQGNTLVNNEDKETVGLKLEFAEKVEVAGTGVVEIKKAGNNEIVRSVAAADITVTDNTSESVTEPTAWYVTIPFAALDSKANYYVIMPSGLVADLAGNPFAGYTGVSSWAFTSSDFEVPVATVGASSYDDGKVSDPMASIYLTFDEEVSLVSGTDWTAAVSFELNNEPVELDAQDPVTYTNKMIAIKPASGLTPNTTYTLKLRPNAVKDNNGNIPEAKTFNVITGDYAEATIAIAVEGGSVGVNEKVNPTITFSKQPMKGTAVATAADVKAAISLMKGSTDVAFDIDYNAATFVATVMPAADLESYTDYTIDIDQAAFKDGADHTFQGGQEVMFKVRDYEKPVTTLSLDGETIFTSFGSPVAPAIEIKIEDDTELSLVGGGSLTSGPDLESIVTFKKDGLSGANLPFMVQYDEQTQTITILPDGNLVPEQTYYYGIGASVKDASGNVTDGKYGTFTAMEDPGPVMATVTEFSPAKGAVHVAEADNKLVATLTFDRQLRVGAGPNMDAKLYVEGEPTLPIATYTIGANDINGNKLTITFDLTTADLASNKVHYITVPEKVVEGNSTVDGVYPQFAEIAASEWEFTAEDTEKPMISVSPTALDVALDVELEMTANEPVVLGTGNILIKEGTTTVETIAVNATNLELAEDMLSVKIKHADFVKYSTEYTVEVPTTALADTSGNDMAALQSTWQFRTLENPPVNAPTLVPANNSDLVSTSTPFTLTFDEPMAKGVAGHTIFLVKQKEGSNRATIDTNGNLVAGDDELVKALLVESADVVVNAEVVDINFGVTLEEDAAYYVLVETGSFKDQSEGGSAPGDFTGLTNANEWSFNTGDVNAPTYEISFTERGTGKMAYDSDIMIEFSKAVEKTDGTAITNAEVANLFTVKVDGTDIDYTGTIDADRKVITLTNSSFNPPIEMTNSQVSIVGSVRGEVSDKNVTVSETINTSDYEKPTLSEIMIMPDAEGMKAKVTFESNEAGKVYYIYMEGDANTDTPDEATIKAGTAVTVEATTSKEVELTELSTQTSYVVFAVAEDQIGNVSSIESKVFTTPDVTAPTLADGFTLPTEFDENGKLTLKFSEDVKVMPLTKATVYNKATGVMVTTLDLMEVQGKADELITSEFSPIPSDVVEYYVEIEGGKITDMSNNEFAGIYRPNWMVATKDMTKPMIASATDFTKRQAADATFEFTFNEDVKLADPLPAGAVVIYDSSNEVYEVVDAANVSVDGATVTVDPSRTFMLSTSENDLTTYKLVINDAAILDLAGNVYDVEQDNGATAYEVDGMISAQFTIVDETAASAVFGPATVEATTNELTITFDEVLYMLDGSAIDDYDVDTLVTFMQGTEEVMFDASISTTSSTTVITIGSFMDLGEHKGETFTYGFKAAFEDMSGNVVAADSKDFTVPMDPVTVPDVTFTPDNEVDADPTIIPIDQVFTIAFDGQLYTSSSDNAKNNIAVSPAYLEGTVAANGTTSTGAIVLKTSGSPSTYIPFTAEVTEWTADTTIVTITPDESLVSETSYELAVVSGMLQYGTGNTTELTATSGNYADNSYKAQDVVAPVVYDDENTDWVDGYTPKSGDVIVKTDMLKVKFSEDVMAGTGDVKIYRWDGVLAKTIDASTLETAESDKTTVMISALDELPTNTEYYVIIPQGAITDLAGNDFAGITAVDEWRFKVQDDAIPHYVSLYPSTPNTRVDANLVIEFDRPVEATTTTTTGFVAVYKADGTAVQLIRLPSNDVKVDGDRVTIDIADLATETEYKVEVAPGTFKSTTGVEFEGIASSEWMFTTESNTAPQLVADGLTPADGATEVAVDAKLLMEFNMDVVAGSGTIDIHKDDVEGTIVAQIAVTDPAVVIDTTTVEVDLAGVLEPGTAYFVIVNTGVVTNTSASPELYSGLLQPTDWNFTTVVDGDAPTATYTPNGETTADAHPTFTITFDEEVKLSEAGGSLMVTEKDGTDPVLTLALTEDMLGEDGMTVTVEYDAEVDGSLLTNTEYFVTVDAGTFTDIAGNAWEGVADATTWTFTTGADYPTGIDVSGSLEFKVYPNPFDGYVNISNADKLSRIVISNVAGQRVKDIVNPENTIRTGDLRSGIYFVTLVKDDAVVKTERIVKR